MKRLSRRTVIASAVVVVLCGLAYLTATSDVVELATSGDVEVLRDPMRPIRGETRVLLIGLDGVGASVLYEEIRNGAMPNVSALLGTAIDSSGLWEHAYGAQEVMSVLPAETTAGWTAVFTGARPADSGVPGNEWFARDSLAFYAPVPLSVDSYAHTLRIYTDGLVGDRIQVPTLFERVDDLRSHVALGFVSRGADLLTPPNFSQAPRLLGNLVDAALDRSSVGDALYEALDQSAVTGLRNASAEYGLADLQFVYFPGVDLLTHASDSALHRQRSYLHDIIDPAIGAVLDLYRSRGVLDQTYVLFVADHGHTPALRDDEHSLDQEPLAFLDSLGLRVREPGAGTDDTGRYDAVFAANEAFGYIYLADRSTCPAEGDACDWDRPPRLEEDVLPVARAIHAADSVGVHVPELQGTIDLILVRRPPRRDPAGGNSIRGVPTDSAGSDSSAGARPDPTRADSTAGVRPDSAPSPSYQIFDGDSLIPLDTYLARNPRPDLAQFAERISWLAGGPYAHHAGDIILLARGGADIPLDQRYYFAPPHHSGHGGAGPQDGSIPILLANPRLSGAQLRVLLHDIVGRDPSQLSVTPLVEALLERNELAPH